GRSNRGAAGEFAKQIEPFGELAKQFKTLLHSHLRLPRSEFANSPGYRALRDCELFFAPIMVSASGLNRSIALSELLGAFHLQNIYFGAGGDFTGGCYHTWLQSIFCEASSMPVAGP